LFIYLCFDKWLRKRTEETFHFVAAAAAAAAATSQCSIAVVELVL
jgi:hypothetical protein